MQCVLALSVCPALYAYLCSMCIHMFSSEERALALSGLVLWPRFKTVIPPHMVTASLGSMWKRLGRGVAGSLGGADVAAVGADGAPPVL